MSTTSLAHCLGDLVKLESSEQLAIAGFSLDSRSLQAGEVFVALSGAQADGRRFIAQALAAGAAAVLYDPAGAEPFIAELGCSKVPLIGINRLQHQLGWIASRFYGGASSIPSIVAVTGTNGKTTVSQLVAQAVTRMSHQAMNAGVIGTLGVGLVNRLALSPNTTPNALEMQRLLAEFAKHSVRLVALEASSHGLDQGRLDAVPITTAVWTNISRDHLDYHTTMDAYIAAKAKILDFPSLKTVWFNLDDPVCAHLARANQQKHFEVKTYSVNGAPKADLTLTDFSASSHGINMTISGAGKHHVLESPLMGAFNIENLLAAYGALISEGFEPEQALDGLSQVPPVQGRMQTVHAPDDIVFVIDYAHTPDALEKIITSVRPHVQHRLLVVFGCGGDRDKGKRAQMAKAVERCCVATDIVVVTSDNPRSEEPVAIIDDIISGFDSLTPMVRENRRDAIETAWAMSEAGDVILLAGKGHEAYQEIKGERVPFSDAEVARSVIAGHAVKKIFDSQTS